MVFFLKNTINNSANISIGSVSADMKKRISVIYRIGRFEKWHLSVYIGIGRYEKKLIGRTLSSAHAYVSICPQVFNSKVISTYLIVENRRYFFERSYVSFWGHKLTLEVYGRRFECLAYILLLETKFIIVKIGQKLYYTKQN